MTIDRKTCHYCKRRFQHASKPVYVFTASHEISGVAHTTCWNEHWREHDGNTYAKFGAHVKPRIAQFLAWLVHQPNPPWRSIEDFARSQAFYTEVTGELVLHEERLAYLRDGPAKLDEDTIQQVREAFGAMVDRFNLEVPAGGDEHRD